MVTVGIGADVVEVVGGIVGGGIVTHRGQQQISKIPGHIPLL